MTRLQQNRAVARPAPVLPPTPIENPPPKDEPTNPAENAGRDLGLAVLRGDPSALGKILDLAKAENLSFNSNHAGLDQNQWGDLARSTFAPLNAAFDVICEGATNGNQFALNAVVSSLPIRELNGLACQSLGALGGKGNAAAVDVLTTPDKYGILLASAVANLKPAADSGNQKAIDFLAAAPTNEANQGLWFMAADGLDRDAESGNPVAVDAFIGWLSSTNQNVRKVVIPGLQKAAANQNAKAAQALRAAGLL